MTLSSSKDAISQSFDSKTIRSISDFPMVGYLESKEQIRRFELLRLAFFALKLRKVEQRLASEPEAQGRFSGEAGGKRGELEFRCSLLRHVIFQQVLALIKLDAREQALQIIEACRR